MNVDLSASIERFQFPVGSDIIEGNRKSHETQIRQNSAKIVH